MAIVGATSLAELMASRLQVTLSILFASIRAYQNHQVLARQGGLDGLPGLPALVVGLSNRLGTFPSRDQCHVRMYYIFKGGSMIATFKGTISHIAYGSFLCFRQEISWVLRFPCVWTNYGRATCHSDGVNNTKDNCNPITDLHRIDENRSYSKPISLDLSTSYCTYLHMFKMLRMPCLH